MFRHNLVMSDPQDTASRVCRALSRGRLELDRLTARGLSSFLGKTTSVVYHHFGSLDGLLFAVAQRGYAELSDALRSAGSRLDDLAEAFVTFGLARPALYHLMFERRYDWAALRRAGAFDKPSPGLELFGGLTDLVRRTGSPDPEGDARLLFAGLHGTVSLASTGRANVGALAHTDREIAIAAARSLARRICPAACQETP